MDLRVTVATTHEFEIFSARSAAPFSLELIQCPNIFTSRLHLCVLPVRLRLSGYYSCAHVVPEVLTALWVLSMEQEARRIPQAHQLGASCHLGNRSLTGYGFFLQHELSPLSMAEDAMFCSQQAAQVDLDTLLSVFPDLTLPCLHCVSHPYVAFLRSRGLPPNCDCLQLLKGEKGRALCQQRHSSSAIQNVEALPSEGDLKHFLRVSASLPSPFRCRADSSN